MISLLFSLIAGALSTLSPCVLPIVPIIMASAMQTNRHGPLALLVGVTLSYTLIGTLLTLFGSSLGISSHQVRYASAALMLIFGATFLIPALNQLFIKLITPLTQGTTNRVANFQGDSILGQGMLGLMLGVVWSPCVGPTLGSAITWARHTQTAWWALIVMFSFGLGASLPMGVLAYSSRASMGAKRNTMLQVGRWGKLMMGWGLVLVGVMVLSGADHAIETVLTQNMPSWLIDLTTRY